MNDIFFFPSFFFWLLCNIAFVLKKRAESAITCQRQLYIWETWAVVFNTIQFVTLIINSDFRKGGKELLYECKRLRTSFYQSLFLFVDNYV